MEKMNKIVTALDVASESKFYTVIAWLIHHSMFLDEKGMCPMRCSGEALETDLMASAYVDHGRWLAVCPFCGKSNYADPHENIFYCFACGNNGTGKIILVDFPEGFQEIEQALVKRPVRGAEHIMNLFVRAPQEEPSIPGLYRNWKPGISPGELRKQNKHLGLE